jgi:hypothetical protein
MFSRSKTSPIWLPLVTFLLGMALFAGLEEGLAAVSVLVTPDEPSAACPEVPAESEESSESDSTGDQKEGDMGLVSLHKPPPHFRGMVVSLSVPIWKSLGKSKIHKPPEHA